MSKATWQAGVATIEGVEYLITYSEKLSWSGRVPMHLVHGETARSACGVETSWCIGGEAPEPTCKRCLKAWRNLTGY